MTEAKCQVFVLRVLPTHAFRSMCRPSMHYDCFSTKIDAQKISKPPSQLMDRKITSSVRSRNQKETYGHKIRCEITSQRPSPVLNWANRPRRGVTSDHDGLKKYRYGEEAFDGFTLQGVYATKFIRTYRLVIEFAACIQETTLRLVPDPRTRNGSESINPSIISISTMSPPAAKRQRPVDHNESTRNINVVKGGLSIMCPAVRA